MTIKYYILCVIFLSSYLQLAWLVNPGFRTAITEKGFEYIVQVGLPILEAQLNNIKIPDQHGDYHSPIGKIHWDLTDIHMGSITIPKAAIKTGTAGLTVSASGISLSGGGAHWHYKTNVIFPISDSGSADIGTSGTSLSVTVKIGKDAKGHATLSSSACQFSIGSLSIHFHGGASWLYNLFDSEIESAIKSSLNGQICEQATQAINTQGNKALESLPVQVNIDETALVDYSIVQDPIFTTQYMETEHKGEFFSRTKPHEASISPVVLPGVGSPTRMLYIWLTTYIANTAGIVYDEAGELKTTITPDEVPSSIPIKLNTASFKVIIPALYNKYPNMNMTLLLQATTPPVMTVNPKGVNVTVFGDVDVCVYDSKNNNKITPAFNLSVIVYTNISLSVKEEGNTPYVIGKANFIGAKFSLTYSSIGNFDAKLLQGAVNFLCQAYVIKELNKYGAAGLEIPLIDGVQLINPEIKFGTGYITIDTDINYKPSEEIRARTDEVEIVI
ncbi:Lipopolysaccharide-binding protein-like [Oopsacas minuta]|uniref:Lipopolysaccharide-binding protein-like n=1 Tax=Oopsacas minuta TaxID=111878 RepID=A0AAV7K0G0_9METZ|nr:Lipopolysaccharide-binding protein-like [Oopsacas minuta]